VIGLQPFVSVRVLSTAPLQTSVKNFLLSESSRIPCHISIYMHAALVESPVAASKKLYYYIRDAGAFTYKNN